MHTKSTRAAHRVGALAAMLALGVSVSHAAPTHGGDFLDAKRKMACANTADCDAISTSYYKYTGVLNSNGQTDPSLPRGTLAGWRQVHGFSANPAQPANDEVRLSYYNRGDLAIGRDMHCRAYTPPIVSPTPLPFVFKTLACYVSNFGDGTHDFINSNPGTAIANATAATHPLATVVMETTYTEGFGFAESEVRFGAYGANGLPLKSVALDISNNGNNAQAVPGNCMTCHGGFGRQGQGSKIDVNNGQVLVQSARFLPFDPSQYLYGDGTRKQPNAAEQEQFRKLNALVRSVYAPWSPHPIKDLIDGLYTGCGGVNTPGCTVDEQARPFLPSAACTGDKPGRFETCGWSTGVPRFAGKKPGFDIKAFYKSVPASYCRTCHVAQPEIFNVQSFKSWSDKAALVDVFVRGNHQMPFAQATYENFWADTAAQSQLSKYLDDIPVSVPLTPKQQCVNSCNAEIGDCMQDAHNGPQRGACAKQGLLCKKACPAQ